MNLNIEFNQLRPLLLLALLQSTLSFSQEELIEIQLEPQYHNIAREAKSILLKKHKIPTTMAKVVKVSRCQKPTIRESNRKIMIVCFDNDLELKTYDYKKEKVIPIIESFQFEMDKKEI